VYEVGQDPVPNRSTGLDTLTSIALRHGLSLTGLAALNPGLNGTSLTEGQQIVVRSGIRPAQLAVLSPDVPQTLTLRRIP
jgi:hypothetical protein